MRKKHSAHVQKQFLVFCVYFDLIFRTGGKARLNSIELQELPRKRNMCNNKTKGPICHFGYMQEVARVQSECKQWMKEKNLVLEVIQVWEKWPFKRVY